MVKKAKLNQDIETKINQALKKLEKEYIIYLDSIEGEKLNGHDFFLTGAYLDKDGVLKHGIVFDYSIDYNKLEERIRAKHSDGYFAEKNYEDCIAHEIAHYMLQYKQGTTNEMYAHRVHKTGKNEKENEADYYAAALLMPKERFITKYIECRERESRYDRMVEQLASIFAVTKRMIERRIKELKLNECE